MTNHISFVRNLNTNASLLTLMHTVVFNGEDIRAYNGLSVYNTGNKIYRVNSGKLQIMTCVGDNVTGPFDASKWVAMGGPNQPNGLLVLNNDGKIPSNRLEVDLSGVDESGTGLYSHAEGYQTIASGTATHAEGARTVASSDGGHAEGFGSLSALDVPSGTLIKLTTKNTSHNFGAGATTTGPKTLVYNREQSPLLEALLPFIANNDTVTLPLKLSYTETSSTVTTIDINATIVLLTSTIEVRFEEVLTTASIQAGTFNVSVDCSLLTAVYSHAEGIKTTASNVGSHAEGFKTIASGEMAHAEGYMTKATNKYAHVEGNQSIASGESSHAEGEFTLAAGRTMHVEGSATLAVHASAVAKIISVDTATKTFTVDSTAGFAVNDAVYVNYFDSSANLGIVTAIAPGRTIAVNIGVGTGAKYLAKVNTSASVSSGHAEGLNSMAFGVASHAEGEQTIASGRASHSEGFTAVASGMFSHAEGEFTTAKGQSTHAEGRSTTAMADGSHVEGTGSVAGGTSAHAEGSGTIASDGNSVMQIVAFDNTTKKLTVDALVGISTSSEVIVRVSNGMPVVAKVADLDAATKTVTLHTTSTMTSDWKTLIVPSLFRDSAAHAEGRYTAAVGQYSHAEGSNTEALGIASHAEGDSTLASNSYTHAEGTNTTASGIASHAEGHTTKATGNYSHAEGFNTTAKGESSHAEGQLSTAEGSSSHAEGFMANAGGNNSHAEGNMTTATGPDSHAEGTMTNAQGQSSHAEGFNTNATGETSHAEGWGTRAATLGSHAEGIFTTAEIDATKTYAIDPASFSESGGTLQSMTMTYPETSIGHQILFALKRNDVVSVPYINTTGTEVFADYTLSDIGISTHGDGTSTFVISFSPKTLPDFDYFDAPHLRVSNLGKYVPTHSEGYNTLASGMASHAEGISTKATGTASHAEGVETKAEGDNAHAEGFQTVASGMSSHAEGERTTASSQNSHAEGFQTKATGQHSHAEGQETTAAGTATHTEGYRTTATSPYSHAEGFSSTARGFSTMIPIVRVDNATKTIYPSSYMSITPGTKIYVFRIATYLRQLVEVTVVSTSSTGPTIVVDSPIALDDSWTAVLMTETAKGSHSEGNNTGSFGGGSHVEGEYSHALSLASHAEGHYSTAVGLYSHAEGQMTTAYGTRSHTEGYLTRTYGDSAHAEGEYSITGDSLLVTAVSGTTITLEGNSLIPGCNVGWLYHAGGGNVSFYTATVQSVSGSNATLSSTTNLVAPAALTNLSSKLHQKAPHAEGASTAAGAFSHSEGVITRAFGVGSHAEGRNTTALADYSHAEGHNTATFSNYSHAEGQNTTVPYSMNAAHIMGNFGTAPAAGSWSLANGAHPGAQGLAAKILSNGQMFADGAYSSAGADYAELFEWADFNPDNEDRVGYFVTLDGEHIRKATSADDYVLGVVSANPSVVGDNQDLHWKGRFIRDEWGRVKYQNVEIPEEIEEIVVGHTPEGDPISKTVITPARIERQPMINPDWNPDEYYARRERRPEWDAIGMMGKLLVRDDGTSEVNGFCKPNDEGIATKSEQGYRVMKRVSETIVQILVK